MALPFSLIIAGVDSGANLLDLPAAANPETPYVDLGSLNVTMSADGGGNMTFDVIQPKTPAGGPWWKSGGVYDNARVQFFDSRYSATTPLFLGFLTDTAAGLLPNGLGTRCTVNATDADGWMAKTVVRKGLVGTNILQTVGSFSRGKSTTTDREHINALLAKIHSQVNDSTTRQLLNTSIISGSTRAIFTGVAQTLGRQTFKPGNLVNALDQIAEQAAGIDEKNYTYFVDGDGRLNYGPIIDASTYANAPAEIVTDPSSVRVGSASTTTRILARSLAVNLDHDQIMKGIFVQAANTVVRWDKNATPPTNDPYFRTYDGTYSRNGAGFTARSGPLPHEVFTAPKVKGKKDRGALIGALARATMKARGKPIRTVSFSVAGGDLAQTTLPDWTYGYTQGYALTAISTYELIKAWLPNQYVMLTSSAFDLSSTVLRIVNVSLRFESGSTYQVRYDIEAEFRRKKYGKALKKILAGD